MGSRPDVMAPLSGLLLAAALLVTACSQGQPCGGQCYPYQLSVVFRPRATPAADRAAMVTCRNPAVIRIGKVHPAHHEGPPGALAAIVITRSITGHRPESLVACLRATSQVVSAGFPD